MIITQHVYFLISLRIQDLHVTNILKRKSVGLKIHYLPLEKIMKSNSDLSEEEKYQERFLTILDNWQLRTLSRRGNQR